MLPRDHPRVRNGTSVTPRMVSDEGPMDKGASDSGCQTLNKWVVEKRCVSGLQAATRPKRGSSISA